MPPCAGCLSPASLLTGTVQWCELVKGPVICLCGNVQLGGFSETHQWYALKVSRFFSLFFGLYGAVKGQYHILIARVHPLMLRYQLWH